VFTAGAEFLLRPRDQGHMIRDIIMQSAQDAAGAAASADAHRLRAKGQKQDCLRRKGRRMAAAYRDLIA